MRLISNAKGKPKSPGIDIMLDACCTSARMASAQAVEAPFAHRFLLAKARSVLAASANCIMFVAGPAETGTDA